MAFTRNTLALSNGSKNSAAGRTWHYKSAGDNGAAVAGAGYFNAAADVLVVGDLLETVGSDVVHGTLKVTAVDRDAGTATTVAGNA